MALIFSFSEENAMNIPFAFGIDASSN
jgi:hypothetical protein